MKLLTFFLLLLMQTGNNSDFYSLTYTSLSGEKVSMEEYRGKKVLIVNTASECGLTPQFGELQQLYERYNKHLVVLGFPSNDFAGQEPLDEEGIARFCEENFGITFPMAEKVSVKGENKHPIYKWLTRETYYNDLEGSEVSWNFQKYLISEQGELTHVFSPQIHPLDSKITDAIEN